MARRKRGPGGRVTAGLASGRKTSSVRSGRVSKSGRNTRSSTKRQAAAELRRQRTHMSDAPPTLIVVIPLTPSANPSVAINSLTSLLPAPTMASNVPFPLYNLPPSFTRGGTATAPKAYFLPIDRSLPERTFTTSVLDAAKVADIILLQFHEREDIDRDRGELALQLLRAQGLPPLRAIATGSEKDVKYASNARYRAFKIHSLVDKLKTQKPLHVPIVHVMEIENEEEGEKLDRVRKDKLRKALMYLFGSKLKQVSWRERYGYMHVTAAEVKPYENGMYLHVGGFLRGRATKANRLLHITGFGSFVVKEIRAQGCEILSRRDTEGEDLKSEAEPDWTMNEQTWPPEVDVEGNNEMKSTMARKRKNGVSDYQATWLEDMEDEEEEEDDEGERTEQNSKGSPNETSEDVEMMEYKEGDETDKDNDFEDMEIDEQEVKRLREAAKTDAMFPDEVDTPLDQPARERFAQYRGLKSMRTSPWDPKENLPEAYATLYQFKNLIETRKRVLEEVDEEERKGREGVVKPGQYVTFILDGQDMSVMQEVVGKVHGAIEPIVAVSMLKYENKKSVMHFEIKRVDDEKQEKEIGVKDTLEFHCGFVRYLARPMFSEQNHNSDKHKMERFLRHGRYTVASVYGKAIFQPAPALVFRPGAGLVATGSSLGANPDRIVLEKIVLTGYVFKAHKRKATVRFMFFNPDDVRWFKPVELYTKYGRTGHILEPLGTHGYFKCTFDRSIQHHDTVCMSLYRRVYPEHP